MSELLQASHNLIEHREQWTRGARARNSRGHPVSTISPEAITFCAIGALAKCSRNDESLMAEAADYLFRAGRASIADINDFCGHQTTLATFRKAILLAQKDESK